jgi:hypothetical protein
VKIQEFRSLTKKPNRSKYRNVPTEFGGILFDSKLEVARWMQLNLLERAGYISKLERQVIFPIVVTGELVCKYRADFVYMENGQRIVEDVKGGKATVTEVYRLKKKLMRIVLGIEIRET